MSEPETRLDALLRLYMTLERKIDGAVLMMTDAKAGPARDYLESILDSMRDPLLMLDAEQRVVMANRAFLDSFRVRRDEIEGRLIYDLNDGRWNIPHVRRILDDVLQSHPTGGHVGHVMVEQHFERIGKKSMRLSARRIAVSDREGPAILLAIEDDVPLRERAAELEAANKDFMALLSHELRTPLNAIASWAELLKNPALSDEDRHRGIEVIGRNAKVQAQLIADLLESPRKRMAAAHPSSPSPSAESKPAVELTEEVEGAPDSLRGLMVLVVDDQAEAREPLRRILEGYGADVVSARSVAEALSAIEQQRPDVLVSDISMPGRDGYDLIREIRALPREQGGTIPAIALTAFGTADERARALNAGYMNHFAKPIEAAVLVTVVAGLGARRLRTGDDA